MSIDDYSKIAQIVFYSIVATVAILTYLKAKSTLLNSVNTEYHKHVINSLIDASNSLFSEFEEESENHWLKGYKLKDIIQEINEEFLEGKDEILKTGEFHGGVMVTPLQKRLSSLIRGYKSDPFLPEEIRTEILDLLENRYTVDHSISFKEITEYRASLAKGKYLDTLDMNHVFIHNQINSQLYEMGCGISQVEESVHEIRMSIKYYLEKFNPL
jgi:hypothetical protein